MDKSTNQNTVQAAHNRNMMERQRKAMVAALAAERAEKLQKALAKFAKQ